MNISHRRPAYASPLLWSTVVALGLINVALKIARVNDIHAFIDRDNWTWVEFTIGMVTLAFIAGGVVSFIRARRARP